MSEVIWGANAYLSQSPIYYVVIAWMTRQLVVEVCSVPTKVSYALGVLIAVIFLTHLALLQSSGLEVLFRMEIIVAFFTILVAAASLNRYASFRYADLLLLVCLMLMLVYVFFKPDVLNLWLPISLGVLIAVLGISWERAHLDYPQKADPD